MAHNTANIAGQRFGKLTALRVADRTAAGNRWLCACDCGGFSVRSVARLNWSLKQSRVPQCLACRNAGIGDRIRRSFYARLFEHTGQVWSWKSEERLMRNVARALAAEGHRAPPYEEIRLPIAGYDLDDAIRMRRAADARRISAEALERNRRKARERQAAQRARRENARVQALAGLSGHGIQP